jgi:hypothetical protein
MRIVMHVTAAVKRIAAIEDDLVQYNSMRHAEQRAVIVYGPIVIYCCGR